MTPPSAKTIVCDCLQVTEAQLVKAIRRCKIRELRDIIDYTSAGDGCTACHPVLRDYLERERQRELEATSPLPSSAPLDSSPVRSL